MRSSEVETTLFLCLYLLTVIWEKYTNFVGTPGDHHRVNRELRLRGASGESGRMSVPLQAWAESGRKGQRKKRKNCSLSLHLRRL